MTLRKSGDKALASGSIAAPSSKLPIYCVSDRLTSSEDNFLRHQKKRVNEAYPQFRPESTDLLQEAFGDSLGTECGRFVTGLIRSSSKFENYFTAKHSVFRSKLSRCKGDDEALQDLMHEIAVVALLLTHPGFDGVIYEPMEKGPDIAATFDSREYFLEVTRIRDSGEKIAYKRVLRSLETRLSEVESPFSVTLETSKSPSLDDLKSMADELFELVRPRLDDPKSIGPGPYELKTATATITFWELPTKVTRGTAFSEGYRQFLFQRKDPSKKIADVVRDKLKRGQFGAGPTILVVRTMAEDLDDYHVFVEAMNDLSEDHGGDPDEKLHRLDFFERYQGLHAVLFQHSWPVDGKQNFLAVNYHSSQVLPEALKEALENLPLWPR